MPAPAARWLIACAVLLLLAACAGTGKRNADQAPPRPAHSGSHGHHSIVRHPPARRAAPAVREGAAPWSERDHGPPDAIDVADVPEAEPIAEPLAAFGNHSPYTVLGRTYRVMQSARGHRERGVASWYGKKFHGRRTSTREPYDMYAMTAAHKTLPLPTFARVTNLDNGRSVVLRINDRGPFVGDRVIDLSYAAAARLGILGAGTGRVEVETIVPSGMHATVAPRNPTPERRNAATAQRPTAAPAVASAQPHAATAPALATTASHDRAMLQAGAFASRDNAERMAERLRGYAIEPVRVDRDLRLSGSVWRVRIGPLADVESVALVSSRLRALGIQAVAVNLAD